MSEIVQDCALAHWPPGLKVRVECGVLVVRKGRCVVERWPGVGETRVETEPQMSG